MILLYLEDPWEATDVSYLIERACCISQDVRQINDFSCLRKDSRVVDRPHPFNCLKKTFDHLEFVEIITACW